MPTLQRALLTGIMMSVVYRIRNWHEHFETYESRKRRFAALDWVPMPTKHDGRGFKRVTRLRNAPNVLLGWYLAVQVAAKMPVRGLLADLDGPLDAEDLSDKTSMPKTVFESAFTALIDEKIGWLERLEWDTALDFRQNCRNLLWPDGTPAFLLRPAGGTARRSEPQPPAAEKPPQKEQSPPGDPLQLQPAAANPSDAQRAAADHSAEQRAAEDERLHSNAEHSIEVPPGAPLPGAKPADLIHNTAIAKRLICEKIMPGKDSGQLWSPDAENRLAKMCDRGIPISEILKIGRYRSVAKSEDLPELAKRKDPIRPTTLMLYWADELASAEDFESRHFKGNGAKDPPRWREFFRWQYDNPQISLPETFERLDPDQKKEYGREFEKFEEATR